MAGHEDLIKALKELTAKLEAETVDANRPSPTPDEEFALHVAFLAVRYYAETHPRPSQVNMGQAAEMLGLSRSTVSKMIRFGTIKLNASGLIPIEQIDQARSARQ